LKRILCWSFESDLALIQFDVSEQAQTPYLEIGESASATEGQWVLVIGNPEGLYGTVSDGIISAFRDSRNIIQITAPISPGSSGSPVLSETGKVIGIVDFAITGAQNLNFAIASDALKALNEDRWRASAEAKEPAAQPELSNAQGMVNVLYDYLHEIFARISLERAELFQCDQSMWLTKRSVVCKQDSAGFCVITQERAEQLHELSEKYGQ
jgi:hypothetical protein